MNILFKNGFILQILCVYDACYFAQDKKKACLLLRNE